MPLSRRELKKGGTSCPVGLHPKRTQAPARPYYGGQGSKGPGREKTHSTGSQEDSNVSRSTYPRLPSPRKQAWRSQKAERALGT